MRPQLSITSVERDAQRINREVFGCWCIPNTICGQKSDRLFAYHTPRTVSILDRSLGLVKNALMLAIFLYVFIFNMWYKGVHFELSEVEGIVQQHWSEPTWNFCKSSMLNCEANFTDVRKLHYCEGYEGGEPSPAVRRCEYFDARELPITLSSGILLPTYIETYKQKRRCEPGVDTCQKKYEFVDGLGLKQRGEGWGEAVSKVFVANSEEFTVTLDHSFRTTDGKVSYDDFLMQGRWSVCEKEMNRNESEWLLEAATIPRARDCLIKPMKCAHNHCDEIPFWEEASAWGHDIKDAAISFLGRRLLHISQANPADTKDGSVAAVAQELKGPKAEAQARRAHEVVSVKAGDVFTLGTLLAMAGDEESLDEWWTDEDDGIQSLRTRGTAVVVHIHYDNMEPWTLFRPRDPPWYTISVTTRPAPEFKHSYVAGEAGTTGDETKRKLIWAYGVQVIVKQTGKLRTFSVVNTLMTITTAFVLLATANALTDFLALYVMPRRLEYKDLIYEEDAIYSVKSDDDESKKDENSPRDPADAPRQNREMEG